MNRFKLSAVLLLVFTFGSVSVSHGADNPKVLRAAVAVDENTKPASTFSSDVPKLYAFYIGEALKPGDQLRGVWIAEDVGSAAPKNTKIDEASITAKTATDSGAFTLSKPTNGWPVGDYRVDIYVGDKVAESVKFNITKAAGATDTAKEAKGDAKGDTKEAKGDAKDTDTDESEDQE